MFLCKPCFENRMEDAKVGGSIFGGSIFVAVSVGKCEDCGQRASCSNVPSGMLPIPSKNFTYLRVPLGAKDAREPKTESQLIRLIAEMLAGLQVFRSFNDGAMLGAAKEPWDKIRAELEMFGWTDADDFEKRLRGRLEERKSDAQ